MMSKIKGFSNEKSISFALMVQFPRSLKLYKAGSVRQFGYHWKFRGGGSFTKMYDSSVWGKIVKEEDLVRCNCVINIYPKICLPQLALPVKQTWHKINNQLTVLTRSQKWQSWFFQMGVDTLTVLPVEIWCDHDGDVARAVARWIQFSISQRFGHKRVAKWFLCMSSSSIFKSQATSEAFLWKTFHVSRKRIV